MKELQDLVKKLSKIKCVSCIFLFGSQVNGRARKDSDIDIAVLTNSCSEHELMKIMAYSSKNLDISIFSRLPIIIQFRVLKEGKILFCRDEKYLHETRVITYKKYLDFSAFINKFYKRIIKNV